MVRGMHRAAALVAKGGSGRGKRARARERERERGHHALVYKVDAVARLPLVVGARRWVRSGTG
jgi:hypothetical protein